MLHRKICAIVVNLDLEVNLQKELTVCLLFISCCLTDFFWIFFMESFPYNLGIRTRGLFDLFHACKHSQDGYVSLEMSVAIDSQYRY